MGTIKLGSTGDEPQAPAQYTSTEGKKKKRKEKECSIGLISYFYAWENLPGFLIIHTSYST